MDEVMQALGMMSNGKSPDCTKDDRKPALVDKMRDVVDDSDDDSSDTATETGGSDRENEIATTPTSPSDFAAVGFAKRPPNANIRAPRGIPGINKGINRQCRGNEPLATAPTESPDVFALTKVSPFV
jgi:hypothetical protein